MGRVTTYEEIIAATSIDEFIPLLRGSKCTRCSLCEHDNIIVVSRGNSSSSVMLVGEAPGAVEDQQGIPFSGPAGKLMDEAFAAAGIDTNLDMYLTNICRCRPVAPAYSGKQNYTPQIRQRQQCLPFLLREIELINPTLVIACGAVAAGTLFGIKYPKMSTLGGTIVKTTVQQLQGKICFVMHHPAYVLHQKKAGPEAFLKAKEILWKQILQLKELME